jgi:hypothetical protein
MSCSADLHHLRVADYCVAVCLDSLPKIQTSFKFYLQNRILTQIVFSQLDKPVGCLKDFLIGKRHVEVSPIYATLFEVNQFREGVIIIP